MNVKNRKKLFNAFTSSLNQYVENSGFKLRFGNSLNKRLHSNISVVLWACFGSIYSLCQDSGGAEGCWAVFGTEWARSANVKDEQLYHCQPQPLVQAVKISGAVKTSLSPNLIDKTILFKYLQNIRTIVHPEVCKGAS
jgi:hypothetical protein